MRAPQGGQFLSGHTINAMADPIVAHATQVVTIQGLAPFGADDVAKVAAVADVTGAAVSDAEPSVITFLVPTDPLIARKAVNTVARMFPRTPIKW